MFVPDKPLQPSVMKLSSFLDNLSVTKKLECCDLGPYSQYLIFFVTYERVQLDGMFDPGKPFQPNVIWHSSLVYLLESYEEI